MFTSPFLSKIRKKALRKGVWYKALDSLERGILSLSSRVINRVESSLLGIELVKILSKLRFFFKSDFTKCIENYGYKRVKELVMISINWLPNYANRWINDLNYAKYITLIHINNY